MRIITLVTFALITSASAFTAPAQEPSPAPEAAPRSVLITGASTGIGRVTAELLAKGGFHVFAGARKPADIAALSAIPGIDGIRLDVTVPAEIEAAVQTVTANGNGLFALINNAGVVVAGPMIELSDADYEFQMAVNVAGPLAVTRAFAPMLIEARGRICTTGSISGVVTWPMGGAYTMSKHAIEAYSDTLAAELATFGVKVSLIEPGNYRSSIMSNMLKRHEDSGASTDGSLYKDNMDGMLNAPADRNQHKPSDEVAEAFLHALTDENPKARYMVVPNKREADITIQASMRRVVQRNQDQPYTLSRDELIEMLDAELARL